MEAKRKVLKKSSLNFFVLCETVVAANLNPQSKPTKQTLIFGTIVVASKKVDNSKIGVIISEYEKKYEKISGNIWVCPLNSLVHVKPDIIPYILPVPSQSRVNILRDKDLCLHLQALEPGDEVYVLPSHEVNGGNPSKAMILYKGVSSDLGEGIFFDVSVDKNEVHQSNGTLRSNPESYLSPERVIKVASDRIRITPTPMPCNGAPIRVSATPATCNGARSVNQLRKKFESMSSTSQTRYTEKLLPTPPPVYDRVGKLIDLSDHPESILKKGDQVVWIDDSDPQAGVILEFQDNMDVLLRLDNPIRSLSPPFSLIYTVCVPLCELMKFEDFHGESRAGGQSDLCEKSCQASNENLRNSQLERPQASEPQRIPPRNCYSGATAPPRDLCLDIPPRPPPLVKYLVAEQDSCDFISRDPSLNISPSKISPNLSSSSSNLDDELGLSFVS
ncbi:hypothetical protein M8J76_014307 [Diaphorina citri]|nr:hypothetical protein M8J76_014307 [Diaphorina citri]KAI5743330.1 hypothetical protein M8J77_016929 [Diaphorina citri]